MFWYLLLGVALGGVAMLVPLARARRAADRAEEENQKLAQDRQRLLDFMHLMTEALGEGLSRQELNQRIVHASIICTGALSACIFERTERETMRGIAVEGLFPPHRPLTAEARAKLPTRAKFIEQVLKSEEFPVGEGIVGRVAQTQRGELLVDAAADAAMVKHDDPALAVRSVIVVPLIFRERFFGVLAVTNPAGEQLFNEGDFTLMQSLAEQAALALHNAEFLHLQIERKQLDLDLSIASGIQQMLLPRAAPRLDGLEVDAHYLPAQRVGGDLYDIFALSETRLGVVVADVSGKGIAASLLMAICRTNLRQIAPRHASPASALIELNRVSSADIVAGLYVTLIYAIIDVAANHVTIARAGHELPLIARRDRASGVALAGYVGSDGMAIGMVPDAVFAEAIVDHVEPFATGDLLVLYTDGVTEAPDEEGREFSGARLADVVRMLHPRSVREVNEGILESVRRFTGEQAQRDDFTLVTVKRV
ncbi:MAG TPA: GAF domain-containing SpoIIE family protein phosphatase [Opitutaceae bacterium]|nr:GAF domain-containing SpoIIE family protein phosphatase [Opitutaceae bacterium]